MQQHDNLWQSLFHLQRKVFTPKQKRIIRWNLTIFNFDSTVIHLSIINDFYCFYALCTAKKCPYSELFWSVFSRIRTEYGEIRSISPYSVRMQENKGQNNSDYRQFLRSDAFTLAPGAQPGFSRLMVKSKIKEN